MRVPVAAIFVYDFLLSGSGRKKEKQQKDL
jgi:hypothetical protein